MSELIRITVANDFVFTAKLLTDRAPVEGRERLEEMGRYVLYRGAQNIVFEAAAMARPAPNER